MRFFRYAVDAGEYDAAHRCLTPADRAEINLPKFKAVLRWQDFPGEAGVGVRDFIIGAREILLDEAWSDPAAGKARVYVVYVEPGESADEIYQPIVLERVGAEWCIDLRTSIESVLPAD